MSDTCLTLERVISLGPCHSAETIRAWYPDRKRVRLSTVLRDKRIAAKDRLWLAVRTLPRRVVSRWLDVVVERAIRRALGRSGCPEWETWAARWLDGTNRMAMSAREAAAVVDAEWAARWPERTHKQAAAAWAAWAAEEAARAAWAAEEHSTKLAVHSVEEAAAAWAEEAAAARSARSAWSAEAARAAKEERDRQIADMLEIMCETKEKNNV